MWHDEWRSHAFLGNGLFWWGCNVQVDMFPCGAFKCSSGHPESSFKTEYQLVAAVALWWRSRYIYCRTFRFYVRPGTVIHFKEDYRYQTCSHNNKCPYFYIKKSFRSLPPAGPPPNIKITATLISVCGAYRTFLLCTSANVKTESLKYTKYFIPLTLCLHQNMIWDPRRDIVALSESHPLVNVENIIQSAIMWQCNKWSKCPVIAV